MKKRTSMRKRMLLVVFIGCLIPYLIGGIYLKTFIEKWSYHNSVESSGELMDQVSELIKQSLYVETSQELNLISSLDFIKNADGQLSLYTNYETTGLIDPVSQTESEISEYFKAFKESHDTVNFIFLATEDGGYMEYPQFVPTKNYDPRVRPWYTSAIDSEKIVIADPYITSETNEMVVSVLKRIVFNDGSAGILGISVKLDKLRDTIGGIRYGETGYFTVVGSTGIIRVSPENPEWVMKTLDEAGLSDFKLSKKNEVVSFETTINGVKRVVCSITSESTGLTIISIIDKAEVMKNAQGVTNILILIYLFTLIVIVIIITNVSRRITKPILDISQVINHMTDYDFNFVDNSNIASYAKRTDEIGTTAVSLISLHENMSELMKQVDYINSEMKQIDIEQNKRFQVTLSGNNPFAKVIDSMNILLDKIHENFDRLKLINHEMVENNERLSASEEELRAQIEEIDQQKEYINFLAFHDSLTGLPNRRSFSELLSSRILAKQRGAVVLIDIDDFKGINDILGHVFGDRVLEAIAKRMLGVESENVFVSRFGGDEFLILIEYDNRDELDSYITELCNVFSQKIKIDEIDIDLRFSMGIALFPDDSIDASQLIVDADLAMYAVKNSGKNSFQYFDDEMIDTQIRRSNIEIILRESIANDGFKVVYQPQVDVRTGQIYGYEALLRLKEFNISPAEFIDIAEKNSTIIVIGRIVTEKVIRQLYDWREAGVSIKPVSINFSANQLHDGDYLLFMTRLLEQYNISAEFIKIEITETIFLENKEATMTFLKELNKMGIQIAIDDFGTGYSSLNYITFLPVDIIKLDRSLNIKFLGNMNEEVMNSMISLVHSLGLVVIAEGIETVEQVKRLNDANCDFIQGYYFSKPLEAEKIPEINEVTFENYK